MERAFHLGPHGRWWNNPELAQKLGLTADQQKKMEAVFEQSRPSLMDLSASLRKEESGMEPLLAADQPDEAAYTASETAAIRYVRHFSDELLRIEVSFALADSPGSRQSANSSAKTETCVFQRR